MVGSMVKSSQNVGIELRLFPKLVVVLLIVSALAVSLSGDAWLGPSGWSKILPFGLLLYTVAGVI
jgi:hypothetical protein